LRAEYYTTLQKLEADVVLTGSGGDQIFGSVDLKPLHLADDVQNFRWAKAWRAAGAWRGNASSVRSESFWLWKYGVQGAIKHARHESLIFGLKPTMPAWLAPSLREKAHGRSLEQIPHRLKLPSAQNSWEMLYRLAESESRGANLNPPSIMAHPLFYRPLAEFMIALPPRYRRAEFGDRALQRSALRKLVPDAILDRKDKGTNQKLREQSFLDHSDWTDGLLDQPLIEKLGWVEGSVWREAVNKARFGLVENAMAFDSAMCVEWWLRQNKDRLHLD
jgi:asparagine synthetase B (glutamine-hydrolysing)